MSRIVGGPAHIAPSVADSDALELEDGPCLGHCAGKRGGGLPGPGDLHWGVAMGHLASDGWGVAWPHCLLLGLQAYPRSS